MENVDFFVKKVENGGGVFVKKVDLSSTQGALCTVSVFFYFTFYLFGGVRTHPTPLPTGLCRPIPTGVFTLEVRELD